MNINIKEAKELILGGIGAKDFNTTKIFRVEVNGKFVRVIATEYGIRVDKATSADLDIASKTEILTFCQEKIKELAKKREAYLNNLPEEAKQMQVIWVPLGELMKKGE